MLSQVHVDDIPGGEWESILVERCGLAPSHCKLLVKVFKELQVSEGRNKVVGIRHDVLLFRVVR